MRLTQEEVEQQKKIIIEKAILVFNTKGYDGTNMQDIASEANVSRSPLYYYFGNKAQLFNIAFTEYTNHFIDFSRGIYLSDLNVFEKIEKELNEVIENPLLSGSRLRADARSLNPEISEAHQTYDYFKKQIYNLKLEAINIGIAKGEIINDHNVDTLVDLIFVFFHGLISEGTSWILEENEGKRIKLIKNLTDSLRAFYGH